MSKKIGKNRFVCRHDYKNAIPVGKVDHICPLCKVIVDPTEWFFFTYMSSLGIKFIDAGIKNKTK